MTPTIELGKFEAIRNGVHLKYKIQTITPDLIDTVLDFMVGHFLSREPMTSYDRFLDDPVALKFIKSAWRKTMEAGASIVALEETEDGTTNIIGANMTVVSKKKSEKSHTDNESERVNKFVASINDILDRGNIFEKYNIDKYLSAYGLTVHPNYHGYQIGYRLLECRKPLCEALGLSASGTVFTAQVSQHIARKLGFETLSQQDYNKLIYKGKLAYPNLEGDMKFMGIKYK